MDEIRQRVFVQAPEFVGSAPLLGKAAIVVVIAAGFLWLWYLTRAHEKKRKGATRS